MDERDEIARRVLPKIQWGAEMTKYQFKIRILSCEDWATGQVAVRYYATEDFRLERVGAETTQPVFIAWRIGK